MMLTNAKCELCGHPAVNHFTDATVHPAAGSHFCEKHTPDEYKRAFYDMARRMLLKPGDRESLIDVVANELGLDRDQARQTMEYGLDRLRGSFE